ncbi:MAG: hypothetical protein ACREOI_14930 [bacterium]
MQDIEYTQLIITCEACGNVKRFTIASQDECERIFREFHCENSCGRNLYSFITLGTLHRELELQAEMEEIPSEESPQNAAQPSEAFESKEDSAPPVESATEK